MEKEEERVLFKIRNRREGGITNPQASMAKVDCCFADHTKYRQISTQAAYYFYFCKSLVSSPSGERTFWNMCGLGNVWAGGTVLRTKVRVSTATRRLDRASRGVQGVFWWLA